MKYKIISSIRILYIFCLFFFVNGNCFGVENSSEELERLNNRYAPYHVHLQRENDREPIQNRSPQSLYSLSIKDETEMSIIMVAAKISAIFAGYSCSMFYLYYTNQDGLEISLKGLPLLYGIAGGFLLSELGSYFVRNKYR